MSMPLTPKPSEPVPLTFEQASKYILRFGKYNGKAVDFVARTDDGLKYLDWFRGTRGNPKDRQFDEARRAIDVYCEHPSIANEIAKLIED